MPLNLRKWRFAWFKSSQLLNIFCRSIHHNSGNNPYNKTIRFNLFANNREQSYCFSICYCNGVNLTISLQNPEYSDLADRITTVFAFALSAKITFINYSFKNF